MKTITNANVVKRNCISAIDDSIIEQKEYVEFMVIGNTHQWVNWLPLDKFKDKYPDIEIEV